MRLLNRTLRSYLIYSFILLLVTIPLFYFVVRHVLLRSVDKSLKTQLLAIRSNLNENMSAADLEVWSKLDKDIHLVKTTNFFNDRIQTRYIKTHEGDQDLDPFRQIESCISVRGQLYQLTISTSMVENEDLLASIVLVESLLLIALMSGLIWINSTTSRKLWAPFYETLAKIRTYEFNKHAALRLKDTNTTEFTDLNRNLEHLLNKNYSGYLAQKEFTENASHELQTPLAIFQSQLEMLMQTAPLTEEQAALIQALESNNKRLSRLNRSLILITKIENEEYEPSERIAVAEIAEKLLAAYQAPAQKKNLEVVQEYREPVAIRANKTLMEILISNLIANAIKHNIPGGRLIVQSQAAQLTIRNTGIPESLESDKIFRRFYKKGGDEEGIGLGLAIVQRICSIGHYTIQYRYSEGMHSFHIDFLPAA